MPTPSRHGLPRHLLAILLRSILILTASFSVAICAGHQEDSTPGSLGAAGQCRLRLARSYLKLQQHCKYQLPVHFGRLVSLGTSNRTTKLSSVIDTALIFSTKPAFLSTEPVLKHFNILVSITASRIDVYCPYSQKDYQ